VDSNVGVVHVVRAVLFGRMMSLVRGRKKWVEKCAASYEGELLFEVEDSHDCA
jgi:hypothetical protein